MRKVILLLLVWSLFAHAQTVYKTVDEEGRVSYSTTPPEDASAAEQLAPPPEPSPEAVEAAKQRQQELEQAADRRREERQQQLQAEAVQRAQTRVIQQQVVPYPVIGTSPVVGPYRSDSRRPGKRPGRQPSPDRPVTLPYPESRPLPRSPN